MVAIVSSYFPHELCPWSNAQGTESRRDTGFRFGDACRPDAITSDGGLARLANTRLRLGVQVWLVYAIL